MLDQISIPPLRWSIDRPPQAGGPTIHRRVFDTEEEAVLDGLIKRVEESTKQPRKMEAVVEKKKSIYKHRFSDAPWLEWIKGKDIMLLGAGGIGSWVAFALSRMGCNLFIYDMDTVEAHNLGGQLYSIEHVGMNKAEATANLGFMFSGKEARNVAHGIFEDDSPIGPIVISAFDNMQGRRLAFNKWAEAMANDPDNADNYIFIDGRLLAEEYQVYAVTKGNLDKYRATLFEDGEVADAACSMKATTHCSMGIASDMISQLTNFATNRSYGVEIREVPLSITKSIALFTYDLTFNERAQETGEECTGPIV